MMMMCQWWLTTERY